MGELYKISSIDWKPSPVTALATSVDGSRVAASRQDGSLELWLVSPGSIGWHCQLVKQKTSKSVQLCFIIIFFTSIFFFSILLFLLLLQTLICWACFWRVRFEHRRFMETLTEEHRRLFGVLVALTECLMVGYSLLTLMAPFLFGISSTWSKRYRIPLSHESSAFVQHRVLIKLGNFLSVSFSLFFGLKWMLC